MAVEAPADRGASPGRPARRVIRYGCAGTLAIVTSVLVFIVLMITQWLAAARPPSAALASRPTAITGSAVLLADGITVVYSDPDALCRAPVLTATETPGRVVLRLLESGAGLGDFSCAGFGQGYADYPGSPLYFGSPLSVTLAAPLGRRKLVDSVTGRVVPCFDQRQALQLTRVPAGFTFQRLGETGQSVTTVASYFGGPNAEVLVENLAAVAQQGGTTGATVQIVQMRGGSWKPPPSTVTRPVIVRGHRGRAAAGIVIWFEAGRTVAIVGEGRAAPNPVNPGLPIDRQPLALAQLMNFANALAGGMR